MNDNVYMKNQCKILKASIESFQTGLEIAAKKDDGTIDKKEQRIIKRINRKIKPLIKELER